MRQCGKPILPAHSFSLPYELVQLGYFPCVLDTGHDGECAILRPQEDKADDDK